MFLENNVISQFPLSSTPRRLLFLTSTTTTTTIQATKQSIIHTYIHTSVRPCIFDFSHDNVENYFFDLYGAVDYPGDSLHHDDDDDDDESDQTLDPIIRHPRRIFATAFRNNRFGRCGVGRGSHGGMRLVVGSIV